jgi:uncharacterized membrane protein HdeD (DUF308 family)
VTTGIEGRAVGPVLGHGWRAGTRAIVIIGGLVAVLFGLVILARPGIGALTLALLFGLFSLIYGVWQITFGIELHKTR